MEHILLAKLEHYGICGNANEWLDPTCPTENTVSINGHESNLAFVLYGVPQ